MNEMYREMTQLLESSLRGLLQTLQAQAGSICRLKIPTQELVVTIAVGPRAASFLGHHQPIGQGAAGQVALSRQPLLVKDVTTSPGLPSRNRYQTRSFLCAPIQTSTEFYGVLNLTDKTDGMTFTEADLEQVTRVASQMGTALHAIQRTDALQRQVEMAEKFSAMGRLAAGLVHELSNPLDAVNRYANLMLNLVPEGHLRDYLLQIKAGLNRMTTTVHTLGHFARLPSDHGSVLSVNQSVETALETLGMLLYPQIKVVRLLSENLPKIPDRGFSQVVINLIKNATDAMPEGGTLTIQTEAAEGGLVLTVSDTGVGIPEALHASIFEPFFTTKAPGQGIGLGLAISQEIANRYQGTLSVKSEVGRGTTFRVFLPILHLPEQSHHPAQDPDRLVLRVDKHRLQDRILRL